MAIESNVLTWRIPTDIGDWQATVHRVAKSPTRLRNLAHTKNKLNKMSKNAGAVGRESTGKLGLSPGTQTSDLGTY